MIQFSANHASYSCYLSVHSWTELYRPSLLVGGRASKVVKTDVEPVVDFAVQFVVFVADLARSQTLLDRLRLRCRPVLICAADIQDVIIPQPTEPAEITHDCDDISNGWPRHSVLLQSILIHIPHNEPT